MSAQNALPFKEDSENSWIFRIGAISALLVLVGYIATFPVYAWVGNPPKSGIDAQLTYFAANATGWWIITGLMGGYRLATHSSIPGVIPSIKSHR